MLFTNKMVTKGTYYPLGATVREDGVNFAIYSQHAAEVFLLLFEKADGDPTDIIRLENCTKYIWHCFVKGVKDGQLYGYKVRGEYKPHIGLRFNEQKLLLDPYAKAITHKFINKDNLLLAYEPLSDARDLTPDLRDNAAFVPKSIIVDDRFDWQKDVHPDVPLEKLFIYEIHVKGFTAHSSSAVQHRGRIWGSLKRFRT